MRSRRGEYDWHVHVRAPDRAEAATLEQRLRDEGIPVVRRWRYLTIHALTEEQANELATGSATRFPRPRSRSTRSTCSPAFVLLRSWL